MTITYTAQDVTPVLEAIVSEFGEDYRPEGLCRYSREVDDTLIPVCLVGYVIARLSPDLFNDLFALNADPHADPLINSRTFAVLTDYDLPYTDYRFDVPTTMALTAAQRAQDGSKSWGEALAEYHAEIAWQTVARSLTRC